MTRLISTDYVDRIYTKMFSNTVSYQYIGFTINKLVGTSNGDLLNFSEIRLFGKQIIPEEKQYPPKAFNTSTTETTTTEILNKTSYKQIITLNTDGIDYGSGDYILYSSSVFNNPADQSLYRKRDLFNYNSNEQGALWNPSNYGTNNSYIGANFIVSNYTGDWLIVKLPNPIILAKFRFVCSNSSYIDRCPSLWRCYGSNDGINFTEITEASNYIASKALTTANYISNVFLIYEHILSTFNTPYLYIGWTVKRLVGPTNVLAFAEIQLFGREEIKTLTEERQYPSKSYDSFTDQITSSGEILNINPTNYIKETITLNPTGIKYGIGTYKIYTSSFYNSATPKVKLFNHITNDDLPHWAVSYTQPGGTYPGSNYIVSEYTGEWIIIKLINPIILTKFRFWTRSDIPSRSPSLWRCYGSNDGITFTEIKEASNDTTSLTLDNYPSNVYEKLLTTFNIPYLYIGFTIKKLVGGNSFANLLNFSEIQLFGKEELNNTYIIRGLDTYQDGFDSQNRTAAILYIGDDFKTIKNPSYHKLISRNLNSISLNMTDTLDNGYNGINDEIDLGMIFHIKDYGEQETMNNNV
jgi:hypothetical protein